MIKVRVIEGFTLKKFNELKNIKRKDESKNVEGKLFIGDEFECELEMFKYLTGENKIGRAFVEKIEVTPKKKTTKIPKKSTNANEEKVLQKEDEYDKITLNNRRRSTRILRKEQR